MADPNNPLNAPPDTSQYPSPPTGTVSNNPVPGYGHPAVEGDTYPTNEVGAMVPNINRIPGERPYDPADELKPIYDTGEAKAYEHCDYKTSKPDLSNPNDLQSPLNPKNAKDQGPPEPGPYQTLHWRARTMGCPALHENAFPNSGMFETTPLIRYSFGE